MSDKLREILTNYKIWDDRVKRKRRQIKRLRDRQTSTAVTYSDMPKGSSPHTLADYAAELDDLEMELRQLRSEREAAYDQIFRLLVRMHSSAQIDVIYRRYLMLQTWPEICRGRDISRDTAMECHDRGIWSLEKILDPTGRVS